MSFMTLNRMLRYAIIGSIFLIPFIPFVVTNSMFFPFITGKNFIFRIITELIFGLWVILAIRDPNYRPTFSGIMVAVLSFVGVMAVADMFGENPFKSFWSNFERMEGLIGLLHLGAYFFVAGAILNTRKLWWWLANTSVGASVIMGYYGIQQIRGMYEIHQSDVRVDGTMGNSAYLAVYMLFHIFITAILLVKWRGAVVMRYVYGAAMLLQAVILFYTATRGAVLGFLGGMVLTSILLSLFGREYPLLRKSAMGILLALVISIAGFWAVRDASFIQESPIFSRFANISLSDATVKSRFTIWSMAYEGFKERPLLGWGQENFNYVFNKYYNPSLYADEPWFDRAHNVFFDWLIAGGVLGLLAYLSLFGVTLYYVWRRKSAVYFSVLEKSLITGLLAGYFVHNFFVFDNAVSYILFFSLMAYVYSVTCEGTREGSIWARPVYGTVTRSLVAAVALLGTVGVVYAANIPGIQTSRTLIRALSSQDTTTRTELLEKAASYRVVGSQEVAEQAVQAAIQAVSAPSIPLEQKQRLFALAERLMKEHIEQAPNDARLYVFLGSLYDQYGMHDKSREAISRAVSLSPKKQRILYQLAFSYLNQGAHERALEIFREAYESESESDESRTYYAAMAVYAGKNDFAEELLAPIKARLREQGKTIIIENNVLLRAYADTGQYDKVLEVWNYRVTTQPDNPDVYRSRAATYIWLGRNEDAVRDIQKAIELEPAFKQQGEYVIQEIRAGRGLKLVQ